jgi:tetratricopeptide (TPR) repeat protein
MRALRTLSLIVGFSILVSCAGLPFLSGAKQEFEQGLALFNAGKYEQAIPYFTKAAELDQNYVQAYVYLGRSYISLGRWGEAIGPLKTAYRISPTETRKEASNFLSDALLGAGIQSFMNGDYKTAIDHLKEGLTLDPSSAKIKDELVKAWVTYGGKLFTQGNFGEAISAFEQALQLSPNQLDAYVGLAKSFFRQGDFDKALQAGRKALSLDPGSDELKKLLLQILNPK